MTPQEQQLIDSLVDRLHNNPPQNKDLDASQHIQQALGGNADALYALVQTVLVQQYGLQQAQDQLNGLKQQVQSLQQEAAKAASASSKASGGSFLSHLFGSNEAPAAPAQPAYQPVQSTGNPAYGSGYGPGGNYASPPPPPVYGAGGYPASTSGFGGSRGGFLQNALQTAAGVAAGEMVFQGMEDLFHGFGGGASRGFAGGGMGGGETVVNNYYDDPSGDQHDRGQDRGFDGSSDSSFYNPADDASRQDPGGGSSQDFLDTAGSDSSNDDLTDMGDNGSFDDSGSDDFSGNDNS